MKRFLSSVLFVLTIGLPFSHAQFSSSIGEIIEVEGTVEVSFKNGPWQKAKVHTQVKKGDRLRTAELSKATIKSPNGNLHQVGEMTTIHFGTTLNDTKRQEP